MKQRLCASCEAGAGHGGKRANLGGSEAVGVEPVGLGCVDEAEVVEEGDAFEGYVGDTLGYHAGV